MKKAYRNTLIGLWLIIATISLARWWLLNPESFPTLPEPLWEWLSKVYGATCCEDQADLEIFVSLGLSFIVISLFTIFVVLLWRYLKLR